MNTPVYDFVKAYAASGTTRLHMPGHKGKALLGCEPWDLTEIAGADALYEAEGILAESEANASALFGTGKTLFSTEGSSQCIRAMLVLALTCQRAGAAPVVLAARNVHKAFVYASALLDLRPVWLWPEDTSSLCACPVTPEQLSQTLSAMEAPPAAVYVTSPDYLGGCLDVAGLAAVCHAHGTLLLVDNAHGAYLHFLEKSCHPMDLGADLCCDSAHKTLPVLTGGAYLHLSGRAPAEMAAMAKHAMAMFGSTSPSYLTLASLDRCNAYLADGYRARLAARIAALSQTKDALIRRGWPVLPSDPLKLTIRSAAVGVPGTELAQRLRQRGVECEFADPDDLVLMFTPENPPEDDVRLLSALGQAPARPAASRRRQLWTPEVVLTPRQAMFARQETVPVEQAVGRICGAPTVGCPPAIPVAVSGERISPAAVEIFQYYGIKEVSVLRL